jgi:hypothetical protein
LVNIIDQLSIQTKGHPKFVIYNIFSVNTKQTYTFNKNRVHLLPTYR